MKNFNADTDRLTISKPPFNWRVHLPVHPAADLFPLMSKSELKEHAENIQANGLIAPILIWKDRENDKFLLLDGRNRLDALALVGMLGVDDHGTLIDAKSGDVIRQTYRDDGDPYEIVLSLNVHRRHLTAEQRRELIAKVLKAKPEASNRLIAKQVKADDKTVASVRSVLESTAEIPQLKKTKGKDGKARPVKAKKKSTISACFACSTCADRSKPRGSDRAAPTAPEAKPAIPTKATETILIRIADLARDCRGLLAHPEQNVGEIRTKLSQIIKLSDPNSKGRSTKSAASNAKLDPKLFRRAMALETEAVGDTSTLPAGNDVDTEASAHERRGFYAAADDEASTDPDNGIPSFPAKTLIPPRDK